MKVLKHHRRSILIALLTLVSLGLAISIVRGVVQNSRFRLLESQQSEGFAVFESDLPNAECQKIFSRDFPFVRFSCQEKAPTP